MFKNEFSLNTLLGALFTGASVVWLLLCLFIWVKENPLNQASGAAYFLVLALVGVVGLVMGSSLLLRKSWAPMFGQIAFSIALLGWSVLWLYTSITTYANITKGGMIAMGMIISMFLIFGIFLLGSKALLESYKNPLPFERKTADILDDIL